LKQGTPDQLDAFLRTVGILKENHFGEISPIFTDVFVERLLNHEAAMRRTDRVFGNTTVTPIVYLKTLMAAVIMGEQETGDYINSHLDVIGSLMLERRITDYRTLIGLINGMDTSAALLEGAL
jgi:hypothetical protein